VTRSRSGPAFDMPRRPRRAPRDAPWPVPLGAAHDSSAAAHVRLLGAPLVQVGGVEFDPAPGRVSAALYYLAYRAEWVARDEMIGLFWRDSEEALARGSLRQLVRSMASSPYAVGFEAERQRLRWRVASEAPSRPIGNVGRWSESGDRWPTPVMFTF
jgi:hypothetical protein